MGDITVREWKRYGHDRLYLTDSGTSKSIGYYDRNTSKLHVDDPDLRYAALEALAPFLSGEITALGHAVQAVHEQTSTTLNRYTHPSDRRDSNVRSAFADFSLTEGLGEASEDDEDPSAEGS